MRTLYFGLTAFHLLAIVLTGTLWLFIDVFPEKSLRKHLPSIRAVHFGSLYLVPILLGLAYAFEALQVPPPHWIPFPLGLALLVTFSGVGYLFPRPADLAPFYYWTRGWPLVLALIGTVFLMLGLVWSAVVLLIYSG